MSEREKYEIAKQYVDTQLKTMRDHGASQTQMSPAKYDEMVKKVAKEIVSK